MTTRYGSEAIGTVGVMSAVPAVLTPFYRSLLKLMVFSREACCNDRQFIHFIEAPFSDHGPARNYLVRAFLGDWLLMLDTDHEFEPDLLARMLHRMHKHNLDVLTGLYRFKHPPHGPVLYARPPSGILSPITRWPKGDVFPVAAAGAGCLLVRARVFDHLIEQTGCGPFDRLPDLSEDHSFFRRLEKAGIQAWCDPRIECHHLRVVPVTETDHEMLPGETFTVDGAGLASVSKAGPLPAAGPLP